MLSDDWCDRCKEFGQQVLSKLYAADGIAAAVDFQMHSVPTRTMIYTHREAFDRLVSMRQLSLTPRASMVRLGAGYQICRFTCQGPRMGLPR